MGTLYIRTIYWPSSGAARRRPRPVEAVPLVDSANLVELAGAERDLLDLDRAALEIADARVVVGGKADESDGKTPSARRVISLDPLTAAYLRQHLTMLDAERKAFGDSYHDAGWLVCHPDGRPVHPDTITDRFNRLVDRAGVKRYACTTWGTPTPRFPSTPGLTRRSWPTGSGTPIWRTRSASTRTGRPAMTGRRPR
jgi:hypothetical protein